MMCPPNVLNYTVKELLADSCAFAVMVAVKFLGAIPTIKGMPVSLCFSSP